MQGVFEKEEEMKKIKEFLQELFGLAFGLLPWVLVLHAIAIWAYPKSVQLVLFASMALLVRIIRTGD